MIPVGTVHVACDTCAAEVPVTVTADLQRDDEGRQVLVCTPDMTDVWAHTWAHPEEGERD